MSKPVVGYTEAAVHATVCWLKPVDHPNHLDGHDVSNGRVVRTSTVLSWDSKSGRIETRNTIYMPHGENARLNGEALAQADSQC